jgi:acyl-coenzyme A thioesterase PaaI-like protein
MADGPTTKLAANPRFEHRAQPGIAKLIGFRILAVGGSEATVELTSGPQHYNPMGTVHGGVLCDIADAAMGMAFAKARVASRGKTVGLVECDVTDADGRLMARASSTCLVLTGKMAEGR